MSNSIGAILLWQGTYADIEKVIKVISLVLISEVTSFSGTAARLGIHTVWLYMQDQ